MHLLDSNWDLRSYLLGIKSKKVTIATAFASGTDDIVQNLLENNNSIEIILGTINSFSSPAFIDFCRAHESKNISLFVDFGYQDSIHWKLILIEPSTVILGSANFTDVGVRLVRDTCVAITDQNLYFAYLDKIRSLKASPRVIEGSNNQFDTEYRKYIVRHRRMQSGMLRAKQSSDLESWLADESNQDIPIFIWEDRHTEGTKKTAHALLTKDEDAHSKGEIRDFFTYEADENGIPFRQGDIVLCANHQGSYLDFFPFDRIIFDNGIHYIYSFRRKRYPRPFNLNPLRSALKRIIPKMYEADKDNISREDLIEILRSCEGGD